MVAMRTAHIAGFLHKVRLFFLVFSWCLSFAMGTLFPKAIFDTTVSLVRVLPLCRSSIIVPLLISILPLCITVVAVRFAIPILIYATAAIKGVAFGYCLCSVMLVFGSAGWLVFLLLAFSDITLTVILLWLWSTHFSDHNNLLKKGYAIYCISTVVLKFIDFAIVSPFLLSVCS